ncbi:branched-chain amino acid aminotransferase [Saccharothrix sp. Mg75]|uniref:branched-chain amino acid aminotransferase n=1 Tax=Saccharothrix sp. Mg75 TaxID=3445357 RepID=UPI003EED9391
MSGGLDDRDGWIWLDGALVPWRDARLHVLSHGLHYASSVFEGERVYDGVVFRLTEHSTRLLASAREIGLTLPVGVPELDAATAQVVEANGIEQGYVRPIAWLGSDSLGITAPRATAHVAVAAWEWPHVFSPDAKRHGITLGTSEWVRPSPRMAPTAAKTAGLYQICTLARRAAEAAGYDDALLLDYRGYLAEATGANLFLVVDGALHTPTCDCLLDGITRQTVLALARRLGIEVVVGHLLPEALDRASEVFVTGTAYEVQPVRSVDHREYGVGPVASRLLDAYDDLVHRRVTAGAV